VERRRRGRPAVTAAVALIDGLYRDHQIGEVLDRHAVPRRPAGGDIAVRFPDPVPLTAQLLDELYHGAGCSSGQIELLTGQPQIVVRATMHRLGIALRPEHMSPALFAATGRGTAGLPGLGRGRVPRLRFHLRGVQTARLRYQYRAPLARPSRGDGARSRPLDPQEPKAPVMPRHQSQTTDLRLYRNRGSALHGCLRGLMLQTRPAKSHGNVHVS